jgi:hypothetical protein
MTDDRLDDARGVDIAERIDRSFGDGPAAPSLEDLLGRGRRALRRRRLVTTGAGIAAAVLVGSGVLWSAGDGGSGADRSFVDEPTTSQSAEPDPWQVVPASDPDIEGTELVGWDDEGRLKVREGVTVLQYADNPLGFRAPDSSAALAVSVDGAETWLVTQFNADRTGAMSSSGTSSEEARLSFPTFELWLDDQVAMAHGDPTLALVRFAPDGRLETRDDDVTLIQQRAHPDLGPTFAGPDDLTAVAEVRWGEKRWYVLARRIGDSDPEYFPTAASVSAPTLDEFIDYAREAYASGGGLR